MSFEAVPSPAGEGGVAVLRNRPFLLLWLSQAATQIGGNIVLFGLTVIVRQATSSNSAVSALFLTFLVPAVLLSAVAGVYVDRLDRRLVLVVTNGLRAVLFVAIWGVGTNLALILLLNIVVATITVFFAPAEATMIPVVVPRSQLVSANGLFTLTLNGAFALGYALLGPLIVNLLGPQTLILVVAGLYLIAGIFCFTLPSDPPTAHDPVGPLETVAQAERAVSGTLAQLRDGIGYIGQHRAISWSLFYLGLAASLVGVIGVLGPSFAESTLGLHTKDLGVVVLPLGLGIVTGVLVLNSYGRYVPRRRAIEGGLIALGTLIALLTVAGPVSRVLKGVDQASTLDLSAVTSLVTIVVVIAFIAGIAYGIVAISSQTQLQEDLPEDVRGRVFGVLNMLVSVSSFLPIIIVGPISDLIGTTTVLLLVAAFIVLAGVTSIVRRGPLRAADRAATAGTRAPTTPVDPIGVAVLDDGPRRHAPTGSSAPAPDPSTRGVPGPPDGDGVVDREVPPDGG